MQCPLCRQQVSDENQLQVHYLLNCSGYVEEREPSINKPVQDSVQFRWTKVKPTLAREVFLISSLAGSINLTWDEVEECYLSQATDILKGLHSCQLVVDGDPMSTKDFEISDHSKLVNITISEASLAEGSTSGNISSNESHVSPPAVDSSSQTRRTRESPVERRTTLIGERSSQKGALYHELVQHQILHGDTFDEITGNLQPDEGRRHGRTRGNGRHITNDSSDFQQFLRPSQTSDDQQNTAVNEESEGDQDNLDPFENGERIEQRASSVSGVDSADTSDAGDPSASDHEESIDGHNHEEPDGHHHEEEPDDHEYEEPDGHHHEEVPDGHDHEEISDDHDHEQVPDGHHHEEIPDDHDHEQIPDDYDHEQVPDGHHHEEMPDGHDHQELDGHHEVPDGHDHEINSDDLIREEVPGGIEISTDDHRSVVGDQEPNLVTQKDLSTPDAHYERPGNLLPVLEARNREPVLDDNRLLLHQSRQRPDQDDILTSRLPPARPSSAPTLFGHETREPEGGNEDTNGYNIGRVKNDTQLFGYGNIPITSVPPPDSTRRQSSDRTGAWVSGTGGGSQRGGRSQRGARHALLDDQQVDTLIRRSPPGSVFGDQEIRRPPLYTSASSRPQSSQPYTTQDRSVISPLVSPRIGEITSGRRLGPGGGSFHEKNRASYPEQNPTTSLNGLQDRQTPMGSAHTVGSSPAVGSSHQATSTPDVWTDEKIKELLDSLKQPSKRKNGHSLENAVSLRERQESSEVTALKTRLIEREEYIKKLKTRNNAYEKEIVKLRAKEMELAKALSLAESGQAAAKEQEDIVQQLTHALSTKEGKYSDLEREVLDINQTNRLLATEMESRKKVYEIRVQELRSVNNSLSDEVKTLRQDSLQHSSVLLNKHKKLEQDFLESRAVNDSLQDQVKLLEKDKNELEKKLRRISTTQVEEFKTANTSSSYGTYASAVDEAGRTAHDRYSRSTAVNGYLATSEATQFIGRHQANGEANFPWGSRNGQSQITGYAGSKIHGNDRGEVRIERHSGENTSSPRSRFELESYPASSSGWRRKPSSGDAVPSEDSRIDVGRYLSTRSYSSDCIVAPSLLQNGFSEKVRNHTKSKYSQERSTEDVGDEYRKKERRRRERPHSYHSGSHEDLTATSSAVPKSWSSPQTTQFSLRGHHLDVSATSDTSDVSQSTPSPRRGKPFAPSTPQEIDHGMMVLVTRACGKIARGEVKFIGCLPGKKDMVYLGLELEKEDGKHDGEFQGDRFFRCKKNHGIFVPFSKVVMAYT